MQGEKGILKKENRISKNCGTTLICVIRILKAEKREQKKYLK